MNHNEPAPETAAGARVLYITYDGLLEPLGQSQVFQYLQRLANEHQIVLVSYEKPKDLADRGRLKTVEAAALKAGIRWHHLGYHKSPSLPATGYDVAAGFLLCAYLVLRYRIQIIHARSYVPSLVALGLKRIFGTRFIFDMRGFWADQRVDCGAWEKGSTAYRLAKWFERRFLVRADVIVSLTHAAVDAMRDFQYLRNRSFRFEVIPTCVNLEVFQSNGDRSSGAAKDRPFTVGCLGTVRLWYLLDDTLECFALLRGLKPEARLLIINRGDHDLIRQRLRASSIPEGCVTLKAVAHSDVPTEIASMDAGLFILKSFFSMKAVAPTKLGEFLACGVPCLANAGVGDFERIIEDNGVGVVLRDLKMETKQEAAARLLALAADPGTRQRCIEAAHRHFPLDKGVKAYDAIYRSLGHPNGGLQPDQNADFLPAMRL